MVIHSGNYRSYPIGAKAKNLMILSEQGFPVPRFICIGRGTDKEELDQYIANYFPGVSSFAVRSAARIEDGKNYSYAGQFQTYLCVPPSECYEKAQQIFYGTARAEAYEAAAKKALGKVSEGADTGTAEAALAKASAGSAANEEEYFEIDVIIQEMVAADWSGVLFTANPQGILNESVLAVGMGTGNHVVEDRISVAVCYFNRTDRLLYCEGREHVPLLDEGLLIKLVEMGERMEALFGLYQDIEFAVKGGHISILQARPITAIGSAMTPPVILDNSNIVESYPGISLPATQSFVRHVYYQVFKSCVYRLCRNKKAVKEREFILQNMVDTVNGRVYYRISNWYEVLILLPFSSKIIPVWQEMLGVRERYVDRAALKKPGLCLNVNVLLSFFYLLAACPRKMRELNRYFEKQAKQVELGACKNAKELLTLYHGLEEALSSRWDITLVNDMYTFIYTALLKKTVGADKANRILSGVTGLESMKPVRELIRIARSVGSYQEKLSGGSTKCEAEQLLEQNPALKKRVAAYIDRYGDRCAEELKLESRTYRTDPALLLRQLAGYAEEKVELPGREKSIPLGGLARVFARRAAMGIRGRELSRMNRGRIFGIVREILLRAAKELKKDGLLLEERDIFYLYFDEIESAVYKGTNYIGQIEKRKIEYQKYSRLPAYSRLVFQGEVFSRNVSGMAEKAVPGGNGMAENKTAENGIAENETAENGMMEYRMTEYGSKAVGGELSGTPCSGGIAEGEVLVVVNPLDAPDASDKILVAPVTDPGWVFLIARAKAMVVEKGSLLSHTAIVTRELRKPSVVGVKHASNLLRNGDWVRVNGTTGVIEVLKRKH